MSWWSKVKFNLFHGSVLSHDTHTVQPGDTLSAIAKHHYGDANSYMKIYNANRDQLTNPDLIKPGQVLRIPK